MHVGLPVFCLLNQSHVPAFSILPLLRDSHCRNVQCGPQPSPASCLSMCPARGDARRLPGPPLKDSFQEKEFPDAGNCSLRRLLLTSCRRRYSPTPKAAHLRSPPQRLVCCSTAWWPRCVFCVGQLLTGGACCCGCCNWSGLHPGRSGTDGTLGGSHPGHWRSLRGCADMPVSLAQLAWLGVPPTASDPCTPSCPPCR